MSSFPFQIRLNREVIDTTETLPEAIEKAEKALKEQGAMLTTYTVTDAAGALWVSLTNRRIEGLFIKQVWTGPDGDVAQAVGEERFDATDAVLLMDLEQIQGLEDFQDSTDPLGLHHIQWSGPFEVEITDSICQYFGVSDLDEITAYALLRARKQANPKPASERTMNVTIRLSVRAWNNVDLHDFISELNYSVQSNTPGAVITDTELVGSDLDDDQ